MIIQERRCHRCGGNVFKDVDEYYCLQCGRRDMRTTRHEYNPMLAKLCEQPFSSEEYVYELKLDGIRGIIYIDSGSHTIINRAGNNVTDRFPELSFKGIKDCVLDTELVCYSGDRPDFQRMQTRMNRKYDIRVLSEKCPAQAVAFDILEYQNIRATNLPLHQRRGILETYVRVPSSSIKVNPTIIGDPIIYLQHISALGFEGLMAKKLKSTYKEGKRTDDWLKFKARKRDVVFVCGVSYGFGKRSPYFGALICGKIIDGRLTFVGECGTGFSDDVLEMLMGVFKPLIQIECPFDESQVAPISMWWLNPILKVEVSYLELTNHGIMRHASFERVVWE